LRNQKLGIRKLRKLGKRKPRNRKLRKLGKRKLRNRKPGKLGKHRTSTKVTKLGKAQSPKSKVQSQSQS
jgi:hypothetical protein